MKKIIISIAILLAFSGMLLAEDAVVVSVRGAAKVKSEPASSGQGVMEGDDIETGSGSVLDIGFADGSMISIEENAKGTIRELKVDRASQVYSTKVEIKVGQVIAKVQKMKSKDSGFMIMTPTTVTAVRGTGFIVNVAPSGETKVAVFDGEVGVSGYTPEGEIAGNEVPVKKDQETEVKEKGTDPAEPAPISEDMAKQEEKVNDLSEKSDKLKDTMQEGDKEEEKKDEEKKEEEKEEEEKEYDEEGGDGTEEEKKTEAEGEDGFEASADSADDSADGGTGDDLQGDLMADLRDEMREFVGEVKVDITEKQEIVDEVQETDFAEGKTLRDVHGNQVRVMQYLQRPDKKTVHFINLVKRDAYDYDDTLADNNFLPYNGGSGARLDSLEAKVKFSEDVPIEVSEWPAYFQEGTEGLEVVGGEVVLSNTENEIHINLADGISASSEDEGGGMPAMPDIYLIEKVDGQVDESTKLYVGLPKDPDANQIMDMDDVVIRGYPVTGDTINEAVKLWGGANVGLFSQTPPEMGEEGLPGDWVNDYGWVKNAELRFGGFGINNEGGIIGLSSYLEEELDPFGILDTLDGVAGEIIITSDHFDADYKKNIDIIVTPDTVITIGEELLPALTDIIPET